MLNRNYFYDHSCSMVTLKSMLKIGDLVLIGTLCILIFMSYFLFQIVMGQGETVSVYSDGRLMYRLSLSKNTEIHVQGILGVSKIRIENRQVYIFNAPCPHKICMTMGKVSRAGQVLVCIPNKLYVRIDGRDTRDLDGITM